MQHASAHILHGKHDHPKACESCLCTLPQGVPEAEELAPEAGAPAAAAVAATVATAPPGTGVTTGVLPLSVKLQMTL